MEELYYVLLRGFQILSDKELLGSVSDYVLRHATCPVLVCRRIRRRNVEGIGV